VRNRAALLGAARNAFSTFGPDVPLETVAREAGVSRTTLRRHFDSREALIAALVEDNVRAIEERATSLRGTSEAIVDLFHFALTLQTSLPGTARIVSRADVPGFVELADRVAAAFRDCVDSASPLHTDVAAEDLVMALPMADAAVTEELAAGRSPDLERLHSMLHRALFTSTRR